MRSTASILHLDLDAFFASVEQRDKPSLRGRPVIVGGLGQRGVVSTASYEARVHGVRSAMRMAEARARCPHAAFLSGRFEAYRASSRLVMQRLREESPLVEPLSLDEAFVDLAAGDADDLSVESVASRVEAIRSDIADLTGGLTASVGIASSKLMAKIASELHKPDGVYLVAPGTETELLGPMQVTAIPGAGPATGDRLRRLGITTVDDLRERDVAELISILGQAVGTSLHRLARAEDDRPVVAERETKSISIEDTFPDDVTDRVRLSGVVSSMSRRLAAKLARERISGRTVTLKIRYHDFATHTRSTTLPAPTDSARTITALATGLLDDTDLSGGLRLIGVGVSGLADWVQEDLFGTDSDESADTERAAAVDDPADLRPRHGGSDPWSPGQDVHHAEHGDGWVWGAGLGRVTIRFETRWTAPGPVRTFAADDPALSPGHQDPDPDTPDPDGGI